MSRAALALCLAATAVLAAGCESSPRAPFDPGVCHSMTLPEGGGDPVYQVVARDQPQIEVCAARLEEVRLRFLGLGGSRREVMGAYQGQFIFIDRRGVSLSRTLDGARFFALARTGDGRLAIPGAIERGGDPVGSSPLPTGPPPIPAG